LKVTPVSKAPQPAISGYGPTNQLNLRRGLTNSGLLKTLLGLPKRQPVTESIKPGKASKCVVRQRFFCLLALLSTERPGLKGEKAAEYLSSESAAKLHNDPSIQEERL